MLNKAFLLVMVARALNTGWGCFGTRRAGQESNSDTTWWEGAVINEVLGLLGPMSWMEMD